VCVSLVWNELQPKMPVPHAAIVLRPERMLCVLCCAVYSSSSRCRESTSGMWMRLHHAIRMAGRQVCVYYLEQCNMCHKGCGWSFGLIIAASTAVAAAIMQSFTDHFVQCPAWQSRFTVIGTIGSCCTVL
jgi:hypothetical protein